MNEEVKETIKILQNNSLVKSGSYEFIGDSDITYAEIYILLKFIEELQKENKKQKEVIDKAIELLGNYKHYSIPDEKQNSDNEDLVNNAFDILKEVE
jgi:hypothetical protein